MPPGSCKKFPFLMNIPYTTRYYRVDRYRGKGGTFNVGYREKGGTFRLLFPMPAPKHARQFIVHGRVQGVGFRYFAERAARETGVTGWVRNLDDGDVEACANGTRVQLDNFEARLRQGPTFSDVRGVKFVDIPVFEAPGFRVRH